MPAEEPSIVLVDAGAMGAAPWGQFGRSYWTSAIHLGVAGLGSALRAKGYERVTLADCRRLRNPSEFSSLLREVEADVVAFSARTVDMALVPSLAEAARQIRPQAARILGGVHATVSPATSLPPLFHTVVRGEGEWALPELIRRFEGGGLDALPRQLRGRCTDLDSLPFPWRDLYGLHDATALASFPGLVPSPMIGLLTSRGCPHGCRFCQPTPRRLFGPFRQRSVDTVLNELCHVRTRLPFRAVKVYDDSFLASPAFLDHLVPEVHRRLPPLTWLAQARCQDVLRQRSRLKELRSMGLRLLILGAETGSPRLLELLHKGSTVEVTEEAVSLCQEAGIRVVVNLMLGLPTENDLDRRATVDLVKRLGNVIPSVSYYTPMPGSILSTWCRRKGLILSEAPEHALRTPDRSKIQGQDREVLDRSLAEIMALVSPVPAMKHLSRFLYGRTRHMPRLRQFLAHAWGRWQRWQG